jgi:hypothetical protein
MPCLPPACHSRIDNSRQGARTGQAAHNERARAASARARSARAATGNQSSGLVLPEHPASGLVTTAVSWLTDRPAASRHRAAALGAEGFSRSNGLPTMAVLLGIVVVHDACHPASGLPPHPTSPKPVVPRRAGTRPARPDVVVRCGMAARIGADFMTAEYDGRVIATARYGSTLTAQAR